MNYLVTFYCGTRQLRKVMGQAHWPQKDQKHWFPVISRKTIDFRNDCRWIQLWGLSRSVTLTTLAGRCDSSSSPPGLTNQVSCDWSTQLFFICNNQTIHISLFMFKPIGHLHTIIGPSDLWSPFCFTFKLTMEIRPLSINPLSTVHGWFRIHHMPFCLHLKSTSKIQSVIVTSEHELSKGIGPTLIQAT